MTTSVKMTILRIMLLSVTLVFTPLLNYSMASTLDSTNTEPHDHLEASLSNHHHTSSSSVEAIEAAKSFSNDKEISERLLDELFNQGIN